MDWTPGQAVSLETENYLLRSLAESDATDRYLGWLKDPEVTRFINVRLREPSLETIRTYIATHDDRSSFLLGIFSKGDGLHIGNYSAKCDLYHLTTSLGVMIGDRGHWGRRIVIETRAAVLDFLFDDVGLVKVYGGCYSNNLPAVYNYKAQGFQNEGIRKSHFVSEGKRVDAVLFAMHKDEWVERRKSDKH